MNFALTDEQQMIVDTVRGFVETEIYPHENEVERTGFVPPEHVQKVILQRGEADFPQAQENGHARDTSVDRALDAQVGNARRLEDGGDLLRPPPPGSPPA